jgi:hypothetical protein
MSQLLTKHQLQSRQTSKQASKVTLPIEQQPSDTSTDDIDEPQEPTRTQEVPEDVKNCTWTALTFQESQKEAMATQTFSSCTLTDGKQLAQQLAQTTLATTTTTLSGVGGRGNTQPAPQGSSGSRGNPGGNPGGGNPGGGNPGGNPGGGNPGGGGGGNPPAGGGQPAGQQAVLPVIHGEHLMGAPPIHFEGDHTRAEEFIDEVTDHFLLNHQHIPFQSAITRVAYTLSHVKGPQTSTWRHNMGTWLANQPDNQDTYDQFIAQFCAQFMDSQKELRARNKLTSLCMAWPHIDQYIVDFEQLIGEAGYDKDHPESAQLFLSHLSPGVLTDTMKAMAQQPIRTYQVYKETAIKATQSQEMLKALLGNMAGQFFQPQR